ncbi:MAG: hypothetical protein WAW80_00435 [Candidatus Saccharimonadales bacterium]
MGLFQSNKQPQKTSPVDEATAVARQVFDDQLREELRTQGRLYFERVINENAALFKQDLDATVAHINTELRQHVARQLDEQFAEINKVNGELRQHIAEQLDEQLAEYSNTMKDAQSLSIDALKRSSEALGQQHQQLSSAIEKSIANQDAMLANAFNENKIHVDEMKDAQHLALESLNRSVQVLQEQYQQLNAMMQQTISSQEDMIIGVFEKNMAQIVEHYLLGALGDQYDLKAQLPSIIKQMEANKQAIVDDMKL